MGISGLVTSSGPSFSRRMTRAVCCRPFGRCPACLPPRICFEGTRRPISAARAGSKDWPSTALWFQTNVFRFAGWSGFPMVIGNLFFHHFEPDQLRQIGAQLSLHARVIIANEPLRQGRTTALFALICPLIRAHPVTRHDGRVSIAAGFCGDELPRLLGLDSAVWSWRVFETWRGASRLVAERRT